MDEESRSPIQTLAQAHGLTAYRLSAKAGVSTGDLSQIFTGKAGMSLRTAQRLAPFVGSDVLTLGVGNAVWRKSIGARLTANEKIFVVIGESTGASPAQLIALITNADSIGRLLRQGGEPDPPPPVVLAGQSKKDIEGRQARQKASLEFNRARIEREATEQVPDPPSVVLK